MKDSEILDEVDDSHKIVLFSKSSIAFIGLIISPVFAYIIYGANLRYSGQKNKIFGTFITIIFCQSIIFLGLIGFNVQQILPFSPYLMLSNIITTLLLLFPFWSRHFDEIEYKTIFPYFRVFFILIIYISIGVYNYILNTHYNFNNPAPWYFPNIGAAHIVFLTIILVFVRFIIRFLKRIVNVIFGK